LSAVSTTLAKLVAKFAASVGGKFAAGVIDTGGNLNHLCVFNL
jgi:hypothetical protein